MKVSVFIPVFNTEQFIGQAIESILQQTYEDWELVIVDDCSTDASYNICNRYAAQEPRIRLYRNESNLGMMQNWVHSMQYCTGDYWGKLDADDTWHPDMIRECVQVLDMQPETGMVVTRYVNVNEHGYIIPETEYTFPAFARNRAVSFIPFVKDGVLKMFSHHIAQQGIGLIRRRIFDDLGNFTLLPAGDTEMWFRIGAHYKIYCLDRLMHYHRIWSQSFTRTEVLATNKKDQNIYDVRKVILEYYFDNGFIDKHTFKKLNRDNHFVYQKSLVAFYRSQKSFFRMMEALITAFRLQPWSTLQFYWGRLANR